MVWVGGTLGSVYERRFSVGYQIDVGIARDPRIAGRRLGVLVQPGKPADRSSTGRVDRGTYPFASPARPLQRARQEGWGGLERDLRWRRSGPACVRGLPRGCSLCIGGGWQRGAALQNSWRP